jgi:hypothetical protein
MHPVPPVQHGRGPRRPNGLRNDFVAVAEGDSGGGRQGELDWFHPSSPVEVAPSQEAKRPCADAAGC